MRLSEEWKDLGQPYLELEVEKPFLVGIMNGNLPLDKFQYWLKVDYPYLIDYAQILALGVSKAPDLESMRLLTELLDGIVHTEMSLHEAYAAEFGISHDDLINAKPGPVKYSYIAHEFSAAHRGSLLELLAALLPCMWGYGEIGLRLVAKRPVDQTNPYVDWLRFYSSDDFVDMGKKAWQMFDRLSIMSSEHELRRARANFITSFEFEVMCWDAYYNMEEWLLA